MKIGVMIGPERGDSTRKVDRLLEEIAWAEDAGIPTPWVPQVPSDMDALQMVAMLGMRTILEYGDARDIGDLCAVGDEAVITARFKSVADAGATDLSALLLPIGDGRDELIAAKNRTREGIAGISAEFSGSTASNAGPA